MQFIHFIESIKHHESTDTDINVHIKQHVIRNIALNSVRNISDNNYGALSTIHENAENGYYLVKWTSDSYTFQYSHMIRRDFIKDG